MFFFLLKPVCCTADLQRMRSPFKEMTGSKWVNNTYMLYSIRLIASLTNTHCKLQSCRCRKLWMKLQPSLFAHPVSVATAAAGESLLLRWSSLFYCGSPHGESLLAKPPPSLSQLIWVTQTKQISTFSTASCLAERQPTQLWLHSQSRYYRIQPFLAIDD